jgi:phosphate transport system permease protein
MDPEANEGEIRVTRAFPTLTPEELARSERYCTRKRWETVAFAWGCRLATLGSMAVLLFLLVSIAYRGLHVIDWQFLTGYPSRKPEQAGVFVYLTGSLWLIVITTLVSVPLGVGAALYLEEYTSDSPWRRLVQLNIANLAGVPSIVYGILGLGVFVIMLKMGPSILAGALTLSLVILPIVILSAQEALRAVPNSYALGATRWQTTWRQVLPAAMPGIMTGVILSIARALGEAAPLVAMGAVQYVGQPATGINQPFSAMPLVIFDWSSRPQHEFHDLAAGAILVLLAVLMSLNAVAAIVRYRFGKHIRW